MGAQATRPTRSAKAHEVERRWFVVDASDQVLGRLATRVATILRGKHRPIFTPHVDTGEFVVVVNAEKVKFTGKKRSQKQYTWFTGYTGLRTESAERRLARHHDRVLRDAVRRMLPKNKLAYKMIQRLKIYTGPDHPHQAQEPQTAELGGK